MFVVNNFMHLWELKCREAGRGVDWFGVLSSLVK